MRINKVFFDADSDEECYQHLLFLDGSVAQFASLSQNEFSQKLLDGLPGNFASSISGPWRKNPTDFCDRLTFSLHPHDVDICNLVQKIMFPEGEL